MPELRGKPLLAGVTAACSVGFFLFGCAWTPLRIRNLLSWFVFVFDADLKVDDQAVMGGVIGAKTFNQQFNHPTALQQGLIVGLYDLGCLIGSLFIIAFGEQLGRRKAIYIGSGVIIVGTVLQVTAKVISHLIVARVICGVGIGVMTSVVPAWQSEVSPAHSRGIFLTIQSGNIAVGFCLASWITLACSYATTQAQWILPIALQVIFAGFLLVTVPFLVESPRWIANHRSLDEATKVIARLQDLPETHEAVLKVRNEIAEALEVEAKASWRTLFGNNNEQNFRRLCLGFGALYMQQLTGINTIAYYVAYIEQEYLHLSNSMSHIVAAITATQYLPFALSPILFVERFGRRTLLMWGAAALALMSAMIAVGFNIPGRAGGIFTMVFYCLFYNCFGMSYLNIPWMYAPEINSLKVRSKGMAVASASNWLFNGIVVTVTPSGLQAIGWRFYIVWVVFNLSFIPMVYFFYPETRGLSLEQIDHIFEGKGKGWSCFTSGVRESIKGTAAIEAARPSRHRPTNMQTADGDIPLAMDDMEGSKGSTIGIESVQTKV